MTQKQLSSKNDEMPIQHRRLFFQLDKESCLIVVLLFLVALTPRRSSSAYPLAATHQFAEWFSFYCVLSSIVLTPRRRSLSRPSYGHHNKAAAAERPIKAAVGMVGKFVFIVCFLSVQLTPCPCPPFSHPPAFMSRIQVCTAVGLRSRFVAGTPKQSTAAGV